MIIIFASISVGAMRKISQGGSADVDLLAC